MNFNYLCIYTNNNPKINAHGFKVFQTHSEIQEILNYYKNNKTIDMFVNGINIRYDSFDDLMNDVEVLPITEARAEALDSMFGGSSFGVFPL